MSNTYKDKIRGQLRRNKNRDDYLNHWRSLSSDEKNTIVNYSKNPSWWNHDCNNVPKRRHDKILCKMINNINSNDYENYEFSVNKKPNRYYW